MKWSAPDYDNDKNSNKVCANMYLGAYWYATCHVSNPLGQYGNTNYGQGVIWFSFKGSYVSLDKIKFMIRPKQHGVSEICHKYLATLITRIDCS